MEQEKQALKPKVPVQNMMQSSTNLWLSVIPTHSCHVWITPIPSLRYWILRTCSQTALIAIGNTLLSVIDLLLNRPEDQRHLESLKGTRYLKIIVKQNNLPNLTFMHSLKT